MNKEDWLLIYLYLPPEKQIDPIRLMKGLFLFKMRNKKNLRKFYSFRPYLYGPCSFEVYDDLLNLIRDGLIDESKPSYSRWSYYRTTNKGHKKANDLIKKAPQKLEKLIQLLKETKKEVLNLSFLSLLKKIYKEYPEYAVNSLIKL